MPIGDFATKEAVRREAERLGLATAQKKDSQGICFVGKVGIKDFLLHELGPQPHGAIIDQNGVAIGEHDGALFYDRAETGTGGGRWLAVLCHRQRYGQKRSICDKSY